MVTTALDQFHELSFYTLAHPNKAYFIHQHIVDAFTAQHADEFTKPIAISFSLAGLYLFVERKYTGRQVQLAHMEMARNKRVWPVFQLPVLRGDITVADVLSATPGNERDEMIEAWCRDVWQAYHDAHDEVARIVPM